MVDQALKTEEISPYADNRYTLPKLFSPMKRYSRDEAFKEYVNDLENYFQFDTKGTKLNRKIYARKKPDSEQIHDAILKLCEELLDSVLSETENIFIRKKVKELELAYKNVMEKFLQKMEVFFDSCKELHKYLQKTAGNFNWVFQVAAKVTMMSSATEVALIFGSALQKVFHFAWNPRLYIAETIAGTVTTFAALSALSYMKWSSTKITVDVRDERRSLVDLIILHRKGNWIDEEVLQLFPHGINVELLDKADTNNMSFPKTMSWRHKLCYAILKTNTQKNPQLIKNEEFLAKVKMFVRSSAADVWWNRRQIRKLLDKVQEKVEVTSVKDIIADHDELFKRVAMYLYPIITPLLLNSWNSRRMKFLCSTLLFILATYDVTTSESEECEGLKKALKKFEEDFTKIKEICQNLDSDEE